jgi:hypothetical protein
MGYDENSSREQKAGADWTGLLMAALAAPVFFVFVYLGKAEIGFTVSIVLCMTMIAVKLRWQLRRHTWFWMAIAFILSLHIPFFYFVRWPQTNIPTIAFSMPIGIADFLLISGAISLAEKLFSKGYSANEKDG